MTDKPSRSVRTEIPLAAIRSRYALNIDGDESYVCGLFTMLWNTRISHALLERAVFTHACT